jgi:hypothetical protein
MDTFEYPAEVVYARAAEQRLAAARIAYVHDLCAKAIEHDRPIETGPNHWTDRHWLAQSVLNILDGQIDDQLTVSK